MTSESIVVLLGNFRGSKLCDIKPDTRYYTPLWGHGNKTLILRTSEGYLFKYPYYVLASAG